MAPRFYPRFHRQGLAAKNDHERYSAALAKLAPLISQNPGELADVSHSAQRCLLFVTRGAYISHLPSLLSRMQMAPRMAQSIINLANDYALDDFRKHKLDAMVSVVAPRGSGECEPPHPFVALPLTRVLYFAGGTDNGQTHIYGQLFDDAILQ
jgi:hypothetical protein